MSNNKSQANIGDRLDLIKNGFKNFISKIRLPMNNDSKWTLEIVCLTSQISPVNQSSSFTMQAQNYLQNHLLKMEENINTKKQEWLKVMKEG
jgi:hypothetical protein